MQDLVQTRACQPLGAPWSRPPSWRPSSLSSRVFSARGSSASGVPSPPLGAVVPGLHPEAPGFSLCSFPWRHSQRDRQRDLNDPWALASESRETARSESRHHPYCMRRASKRRGRGTRPGRQLSSSAQCKAGLTSGSSGHITGHSCPHTKLPTASPGLSACPSTVCWVPCPPRTPHRRPKLHRPPGPWPHPPSTTSCPGIPARTPSSTAPSSPGSPITTCGPGCPSCPCAVLGWYLLGLGCRNQVAGLTAADGDFSLIKSLYSSNTRRV